MTDTPVTAEAGVPRREYAPSRPVYPQSSGPDGLARLKAAWAMPRRFWFFKEVNNNHIGVLYIATGLLLFIGAGILALLMRIQLAYPGLTFLDYDTYNQFFTMHGTVMMFLFAVPIVEAVAVLLLPSLVGTRDMPFPRLSALGFWVLCDWRCAGVLQPVLRHRPGRRVVHVPAAHRPTVFARHQRRRLDPRPRIRGDRSRGRRR
jgi:Cytochrome C and Quinol oxidase polypeptide I